MRESAFCRKKALKERAGDEERWIAVPRSLHAADCSAAKAQAEAAFDCAQNAGISNNGLNARDRPRKPNKYAIARIEPLMLNRSRRFCGDDGRREDRRSQ